MAKRLILPILLLATLGGCSTFSESRFNPFNWGASGRQDDEFAARAVPVDTRPLVAQILDLSVETTPTGVIVRATGLAPQQGYWGAGLVETTGVGVGEDGLLLEFRATPPLRPTLISTPQSRLIQVARYYSTRELSGIRTITVTGSANARSIGR